MAATKRNSTRKPSYEEVASPSEEWAKLRVKLLGANPDALRHKLEEHARKAPQHSDAVQAGLERLDALTRETDERIAIGRFRDSLSALASAAGPAEAAATLRIRELQHECDARKVRIARNEALAVSNRRSLIADEERAFAPRIDFAQRLIAFIAEIREERDSLTGAGSLDHRPPELAIAELAAILSDGGLLHDEIGRLLLDGCAGTPSARIEQRLRRHRRAEAKKRSDWEALVARIAAVSAQQPDVLGSSSPVEPLPAAEPQHVPAPAADPPPELMSGVEKAVRNPPG